MAKKSNKKKKETELQKALKWINSLSGERAEFIREFANWQSKKDMKNTLNVLDRCMSAAIINVLDLDWDVIEEIHVQLADKYGVMSYPALSERLSVIGFYK